MNKVLRIQGAAGAIGLGKRIEPRIRLHEGYGATGYADYADGIELNVGVAAIKERRFACCAEALAEAGNRPLRNRRFQIASLFVDGCPKIKWRNWEPLS